MLTHSARVDVPVWDNVGEPEDDAEADGDGDGEADDVVLCSDEVVVTAIDCVALVWPLLEDAHEIDRDPDVESDIVECSGVPLAEQDVTDTDNLASVPDRDCCDVADPDTKEESVALLDEEKETVRVVVISLLMDTVIESAPVPDGDERTASDDTLKESE